MSCHYNHEYPILYTYYIHVISSMYLFCETLCPVVKFKRRARYLEFFVQVAEKALAEEAADLALDWCMDTSQWLSK